MRVDLKYVAYQTISPKIYQFYFRNKQLYNNVDPFFKLRKQLVIPYLIAKIATLMSKTPPPHPSQESPPHLVSIIYHFIFPPPPISLPSISKKSVSCIKKT